MLVARGLNRVAAVKQLSLLEPLRQTPCASTRSDVFLFLHLGYLTRSCGTGIRGSDCCLKGCRHMLVFPCHSTLNPLEHRLACFGGLLRMRNPGRSARCGAACAHFSCRFDWEQNRVRPCYAKASGKAKVPPSLNNGQCRAYLGQCCCWRE